MSRRSRLTSLQKWLIAVLVIGVIAFSGTGGTFASFNAETTNGGNSISSGTLTLSDTVSSGTVCLSSGGSVGHPTSNQNPTCTAVLTVTNVAPGSWNMSTQTAQVTIQNTGSLNASSFTVGAPTGASCSSAKTTRAPYVTVAGVKVTSGSSTVSATSGSFSKVQIGMPVLAAGVPSGTTVTAVGSTTVTMSQNATSSATPESVTFGWSTSVSNVKFTSGTKVLTDSGGFPGVWVGMTVTVAGTLVSSSTVVTAVTTTSITVSQAASGSSTSATATFGATSGSQNNFTSTPGTSSYPFCGKATLFLQESATVSGHTDYYCWYGYGSTGTGRTETSTKGLCPAPLSTTLTTAITCTSAISSIKVSAVTGPIFKTDILSVTNAGSTCELTSTANTPVVPTTQPTSISVSRLSGTGTFPIGAAAVDSTVATHMNGDGTHTIKNFLSSMKHTRVGIILYPIVGAGKVSKTATDQLSALSGRSFTVGLYFPRTSGSQNTSQGLKTTFGLTWYVGQ
ncbi:MAG: hypothetical protein ACRDWE_02005 [Acidimicrobiales bacterium]